jgi:hypothetical protein
VLQAELETKTMLFSAKGDTMQTTKGHGRGFASMTPEKKKEIASKGGKAAHTMGKAHKWTSDKAKVAGQKGGSISRRRPKNTTQV